MEPGRIVAELAAAASALGITVREFKRGGEDPPLQSGLVILRGLPVLFIEQGAPAEDRIAALGRALKNFDLEEIYLSPAARAVVEQS